MMVIGFFTSRVILKALGISDLGLMNVAGSVVAMFTFLNGTLASGTQRFITFGLGEGDIEKLKSTFSTALTMHLALAIIILILGETIGLWYVNNKLNIPEGRFEAAMWCYQLSILSTFIGIVLVPFNSAIIAHEKMSMYAYMSIYDAAAKLLAAYLIMITPFDRLIFYSTLSFVIALIPTFFYNWYCRKHFEECSFHFGFEREQFKQMASFSGWNVIGCLAAMGNVTGMDLVINYYCGTAVNGAKSIAAQANGWVTRFVDTFLTAINPQITKNYASGDYERMSSLVCNGAKYGAYLLLILGIPLFIEIEFVLQIWLGQIPEHAPAFMRIMMIQALFITLGRPTITAMHATGRMKEVNLTVGVVLLSVLPVSIILFKIGLSPEVVLMTNVFPIAIVPFIRIFWVNKYCGYRIPAKRYIWDTFLKTMLLAGVMYFLAFIVKCSIITLPDWMRFIIVFICSILISSALIYFLGLDRAARAIIRRYITRRNYLF